MPQLFNRAGMSTATAGQGTLTLASALGAVAINTASFQSFSSAGVTDGTVVSYLILDANGNWEVGTGTYTASGTTLSRTVKYSSNSNTAIALSGSAQVFVTALASDGGDVLGSTANPLRGFDAPVNLQLNATQNGATLTVAVKTNLGSDPTVTNPVIIPFRDSTSANGDPVWRTVTSALSINTNATGATLGSSSNTAFRFWVCAFDNAGTVVLALINCSNSTTIFPLNEALVASTTSISGSATSAGVFYTPNGTTLTNKSFRIIGFIEYNSTGLATAGTYATSPNFVQLFGPGIKKPGDVVQIVTNSTTNTGTTTSASFVALTGGITVTITPTSAANPLQINATGGSNLTLTASARLQLSRGSVANTNLFGAVGYPNTNAAACSCVMTGFDLPNTTSSTSYTVQGKTGAGTLAFPLSGDLIIYQATEFMG